MGALAVIATITYAQVGALSGWFTVGFVGLVAILGVVAVVAETTPCPSCGRTSNPSWYYGFWSGFYPAGSRVCQHCGADLYAPQGSRSE